jgi:hypothetical protein
VAIRLGPSSPSNAATTTNEHINHNDAQPANGGFQNSARAAITAAEKTNGVDRRNTQGVVRTDPTRSGEGKPTARQPAPPVAAATDATTASVAALVMWQWSVTTRPWQGRQ